MKKIKLGLTAILLFFASYSAISETKTVSMPPEEKDVIQVVVDYAQKYPSALNELQKSALVTERTKKMLQVKNFNNKKINDWIGILTELKTTSDGDAYIKVLLSNGVTVSTWNNRISDVQANTLIPQSSPLYKTLSEMQEGNVVKFSGMMGKAKNILEANQMLEPDFLFRFEAIEKIGDSGNF